MKITEHARHGVLHLSRLYRSLADLALVAVVRKVNM